MIRSYKFKVVIFIFCLINLQTKSQHKLASLNSNPLLVKSNLPLEAPIFNLIRNEDFQPALEAGMRLQKKEINKIANNAALPTFQNTIIEIEKSGRTLDRVNLIFNLLTGANTNPTLQKVQEDEAAKLAAHADAIHLNSKLFKRIETIYEKRNTLHLDTESKRLVEYYYQQYILAGAKLSEADKATLKKYNEEEATLSAKFTNQLLAGTKEGTLVISERAALDGLSESVIEGLAQNAKANNMEGKYLISLQNTTQQPLLQSLNNRNTREKLFNASYYRTERNDSNDTRSSIAKIANLRALKAKLIRFPNYATWVLQDQMAKNPTAVEAFFSKLVPAATAKARREAADLQAMTGGVKLEPWDWNYYAEKLRKQKYDLNEEEIKPYFELNKVLENGVFYAANQLYGISFKERHDLPIYQEDVRVFDVIDNNGKQMGLFYCDYFKRDNKSGGAWMSNMVNQSKLLGTKPVVYNVCNFTKPAVGQPALISYDDVTTMFHEFGHALHGLFGSQQYESISGSATARDFVEFPSQFNEHWALYPKILKHYAIHFKTGAVIPQSLVEKIKNAGTFNQGYKLTELLAAAALDMQWHKLAATDPIQDVDTFENAALQKTGLSLAEVPTRYRSSYFLHIWSNGYAAGYYAYLWTEMLDDDAFEWFQKHGGLTRANGQRYRDMILSKGNTQDYNIMYKNFTGRAPNIEPMEEQRGLK